MKMETHRKDEVVIPIHRPDLREKSFFFVSGMTVSIPFTIYTGTLIKQMCFVMPFLHARLCSTGFITPFIEELAKAYPLFYRHGETEKSIFSLGFIIGLGFGVVEFLMYVLQLGAPTYTRLPYIFFHAASTSITAYGIAKNRPLWLYLVAVGLHAINNVSAIFGLLWLMSGYPLLIVTFLIVWYLYQKTSDTFVDIKSH